MISKRLFNKWIALALVAGAILFLSLRASDSNSDMLKTQVQSGTFDVGVTVSGELEAKDKAYINAPQELTDGRMGFIRTKILDIVPEGTVVKPGDYVATLDQSELINRLSEVELELSKLQSQVIKTILDTTLGMRDLRNQLKDMEFGVEAAKLVAEQSIYEPPATLRQAQIAHDKAQREYEQAKSAFKIKQQQQQASINEVCMNLGQVEDRKKAMQNLLDKFTIHADKAGMVIYHRQFGNMPRGIGSDIDAWNLAVATLPDMSKMISRAQINEIDINKVKVGQKVRVRLDALSNKEISATVLSVANIGTQTPGSDAKTFEVIIGIDATDAVMRPSMTTSNTIICEHYDDVLYLPLEAIHSDDSVSYVFTNGKRQIVELGASNDNFAVIKKGLSAKQEVLLSMPDDVEDFPLVKLK